MAGIIIIIIITIHTSIIILSIIIIIHIITIPMAGTGDGLELITMATIGGREARKTRKIIQFQIQFVRICKDKGYKVFCNLFYHFLE